MKKLLIIIVTFLFSFQIFAQKSNLIFKDDFDEQLNSKNWIVEMENLPNSSVFTKAKKLVLDTKGGVTVWLNKRLTGNYKISYKRRVIFEGEQNDRVSDLNQFWLAEDPKNKNLFTRKGKFEEYDSLKLFYVGMGGNSNTTTRFRKYEGNGNKPILQEKSDSLHLLKANQVYQISIIVKNNETSFWVNGECVFNYSGQNLPKAGYFGFRSTFSHQEIWNFRVER